MRLAAAWIFRRSNILDDFMKLFFKKKRHGDLSFPVILILFAVLLVVMIVISLYSSLNVIKTTADIEGIAQGDTMLFAMLESGICAPATNTPLKYVLGMGLSGAGISANDIDVDYVVPESVEVNYGGLSDTVNVEGCVKKFMKSVNASAYKFNIDYDGHTYYEIPSDDYSADKPKKTEKIYISVPDGGSRVATVVLSTNFIARGDKACPEKDGAHSCAPRVYCLLEKGTCDEAYVCSASCCCAK